MKKYVIVKETFKRMAVENHSEMNTIDYDVKVSTQEHPETKQLMSLLMYLAKYLFLQCHNAIMIM